MMEAVKTATEGDRALYAFDAPDFEIQFNARPGADIPHIVYHRLRKPTLAELNEREAGISQEMVEVSKHETELVSTDDTANMRLWDKLVTAIKGYRGFEDWREPSDDEKRQLRASHKSFAVRNIYAGSCAIDADDALVSLSGDVWTIKQMIGPDGDNPLFTVFHVLREPNEAEYAKFKRTANKTSYMSGSRKTRFKVRSDLKPYIEMYDALIETIEGGTVGGLPFAADRRDAFIRAIDPIWKRQIVQTLMGALDVQLLD